jgi:hypothetical protein
MVSAISLPVRLQSSLRLQRSLRVEMSRLTGGSIVNPPYSILLVKALVELPAHHDLA